MENKGNEALGSNSMGLEMLSVEEVSILLQLSTSQIRTLLRESRLPGVRFIVGTRAKWLIPAQELHRLIQSKLSFPFGAEVPGGGSSVASPAAPRSSSKSES